MSDGSEQMNKPEIEEEEEDETATITRAEPDDFGRAVTKMGVAQICESRGFEAIKQSALEALSDIAVRYIRDLAKSATFHANLAGRSESNVFDILMAFQDLSCENNDVVKQMSEFVRKVEDKETPFAYPIPRFPVPVDNFASKLQTPCFLHMGETPGGKHIPEWLPAFPDPHTYVQSPMWSQRKLDLRISKGEQARQRRKAERSLLNLQQRLLSSGLAGPSGSASHANDGNNCVGGASVLDNPKHASENGFRERKQVLVKETFAPAIDALKGVTGDGVLDTGAMNADKRLTSTSSLPIPDRKKPVVHFKLKAGKKMLVEDLDIHLRSKVCERRTSLLGREDDKDDKKRRAELILRQSTLDNPQELSQM